AAAARTLHHGGLRRAAAAAAAAGLSVALVGAFEVTRPLAHLGFAAAAAVCGLAASLGCARSLGNLGPGPLFRSAGHAARGLAWLQLLCLASGLAFVASVVARLRPRSLGDLVRAPPGTFEVDLGGATMNLLAALEWPFFTAQLLLAAGAAAWLALGGGRAAVSDA